MRSEAPTLHFSLGPVQGFVAAARRTRDFWAGSWLLSHLSASAIEAASLTDGVTIDLPAQWNTGLDRVAGTPNRFRASGDVDALQRAGNAATTAIHKRWREIAEQVWQQFVEPVSNLGNGTRSIWDEQADSFWEVQWVIGDDYAAAARKAIRLSTLSAQPGFRCHLFPDLQELSGVEGKGKPPQLREFWSALSSKVGQLDLDEGEYLSAIGLIKRLFPKVGEFKQLDVTSWPSTAWVAALPWLEQCETAPAKQEEQSLLEQLKEIFPDSGNMATAVAKRFGLTSRLAQIDSQLLFPSSLESMDSKVDSDERISAVQTTHMDLCKTIGLKPDPHYALLLMDGDRLGELIGAARQVADISHALSTFSQRVEQVMDQTHRGLTIYAGGDDILAIVRADKAIEVASELAHEYQEAFLKVPGCEGQATISGAIVYAHFKLPLTNVLSDAHTLLDRIAKDQTGRDSLAVEIQLPSGVACRWSAPWQFIWGKEDKAGLLDDLQEVADTSKVSSSFLYGVRGTLAPLLQSDLGETNDSIDGFATLSGIDLVAMLNGDYTRIHGGQSPEQLENNRQVCERLARLTRRHYLQDRKLMVDDESFSFDGLKLAHNLAQFGGLEVGQDKEATS